MCTHPQSSGNSRPCPTTHQVDITEVVEPEVVQGVGDERQVPAEEAPLTLVGGKGQAAQNPGVHGGGGRHLQAGGMRARVAGPRPPSLQAGCRPPTSSAGWGTKFSPRARRIKRRAFQSLLQKWR